MDRRTMMCILKKFYCKEIYEDEDYKFSKSGIYFSPSHRELEGYYEYIKSLPTFPEPEAYGFHDNAAISKNQNSVTQALETMLIT
jgi:dynein heavy chain